MSSCLCKVLVLFNSSHLIVLNISNHHNHYHNRYHEKVKVRGSKIFHLFDPSQSEFLHAGQPCMSASFECTLDTSGSSSSSVNYKFSRPLRTMSPQDSAQSNRFHTYSPVDIRNPDLKKHPNYAKAVSFKCKIKEGETLFVPSHW